MNVAAVQPRLRWGATKVKKQEKWAGKFPITGQQQT
jgi:hypothetical protein